jgi:hypothetical protein
MNADYDAHAVLGVLLDHSPAHLSTDELGRMLHDFNAVRVEDTLTDLVRDGLAHRHGGFAFASRAAVRFKALGV